MHKCEKCRYILQDSDLIEGKCPECKGAVVEMCECDSGSCSCGVVDGIKICEKCGGFVCPECGSHDVSPISRVTGYYSPVDAWAKGKTQELLDRVRYDV